MFRVGRRADTPVVARMFSARRAHEAVLGDLAVLEVLRAAEFPAAAHLAVRPGGATDRPAGALHHYAEGTPADDATGLPEAFVHPDPVPKNAIFTPGGPVLVDWAGAGRDRGWRPSRWCSARAETRRPYRSVCVRYDPREGVMTGVTIGPRVKAKRKRAPRAGTSCGPCHLGPRSKD